MSLKLVLNLSPSPVKVPNTPARRGPSDATTPSSVVRSATSCSANPEDHNIVTIHTAKCSVCDKRNKTDKMLRCPGCTWQICLPCQDLRKTQDRSLMHGNMTTGTPGAPGGSTARRQKIKTFVPVEPRDPEVEAELEKALKEDAAEALTAARKTSSKKGKEKATVGENSEEKGPLGGQRRSQRVKSKGSKSLAEASSVLTEQTTTSSSPKSTSGEDKRSSGSKDTSKMANAAPPTKKTRATRKPRTPTPAGPARTSQRKTKEQKPDAKNTIQYIMNSNMDEPFDNLTVFPTSLSSRHQLTDEDPSGNRAGKHRANFAEQFGTGGPTFRQSGSLNLPVPDYRAAGGHNAYFNMPSTAAQAHPLSAPHLYAPLSDVRGTLAPISSVPGPLKRGRSDDDVGIEGSNVRRKTSASQIGTSYGSAVYIDDDSSTAVDPNLTGTLRSLVDKEVASLHHNLALDDDQQQELVASMKYAARMYGVFVHTELPPGLQALVKPGLDLALDQLTTKQRAVAVGHVQTVGAKKLMQFEQERGSLDKTFREYAEDERNGVTRQRQW